MAVRTRRPPPRPRGRPKSPHAAHRRVADGLRARMAGGDLKVNAVLPSIRELALVYETSADTVRWALRLLRQEGRIGRTPKRRLAVMPVQGQLSTMRPHGAILEVIPRRLHECILNPAMQQLQTGIEVAAGELGAPLFIVHEEHFRTALPSDYLDWPLSGIVINGVVSKKVLREYEGVAVPVMLVDQPPGAAKVRAVCVNNMAGAREMTLRVIALGHRRIAFCRRFSFIRQHVDPDSAEREAGFREACAQACVRVPENAFLTVFHTETAASASIQAVAGAGSPFTAAVCADTTIAHLLLDAAKAAGRVVPRDLSIVCFQGRVPEPRFTGMAIDFRELGHRAVRELCAPEPKDKIHRLTPGWVDQGTLDKAHK